MAERAAPAGNRLAEPEWSRGLVFLLGLLSIVAGVIVIAKPAISLAMLAVVMGVLLLVDGVLGIADELSAHVPTRTLGVIVSVISIVAGVILVRHPFRVVAAGALLLGLWLIVSAVVRLVGAARDRPERGWGALVAAVEGIAGIVMVAAPHIGVATLALLVGVSFIVRGLLLMAVAWLMRQVDRPLAPRGHMAAT